MKRIVIEITEEQHAKMMEHIQKEAQLNLDNETLSGYSIHLNCIFPGLSYLELKMNSDLDLGDVDWKIE